jgi:hypothetical protein
MNLAPFVMVGVVVMALQHASDGPTPEPDLRLQIAQADRWSDRPDLTPQIYDGPPPKGQEEAVRARRKAEERRLVEEDARRKRALDARRQQKK